MQMVDRGKNAVYLRLSIEDMVWEEDGGRRQEESNSISSQRKMLMEYIHGNAELSERETVEFCDDGFSGTGMDRPGIQELLKQVRQRKISCILVKDLSRFSRDYIELGTYLNQIFPFMGVRFIALNDHYDSREHGSNTIEIDTAFRTLLYDLYSKDLSVKVKSAVENKCANGEYVFGQVPFGYAKSRTEKNRVVVNDKEAEIVRYIFSLAESGMSSTKIAERLFQERIPTAIQMRYPERAGLRQHHTWSGQIVREILNNRFYLGEMAYGKTVRKSVGSKTKIAVPKKAWNIIPNHHEPLITPEIFARASRFRPGQSTGRKRPKHPLTGKIYCGGCGYSINYKPKGNGSMPGHFWCRKHAQLQIPDCCTYLNAAALEEIVLTGLRLEMMCRGDLIKQRGLLEWHQKKRIQELDKELGDYQMRYHILQDKKVLLYESYAARQIKAAQYRSKADGIDLQMQEISCKTEEVEIEHSRLTEEYHCSGQDMEDIFRCCRIEKLTQELADVFVKKVTVYSGKKVEIEWNFSGKIPPQ